ncbi:MULTISPECIES: AraC family transcriptional regulator [Pseudonocardia]|uniref:HTH-type transcriptional activator RhaS n=2 Tax=Pseudonocardia TaxID=1847 RepID=A0A1Y2N802_PSEAH|nr:MULTISPECIES: AraC family transcriptional regulator [Pseudonocardia]OSY43207.1 HTH-type transcriptional activator RhaS [Pseudonocardia autotrophica]TDN71695.1 AraC-like DNA-binding protein [Pseudonocardia autotrophica]
MPDDEVRSEYTAIRDVPVARARDSWRTLTTAVQGSMSCDFGDRAEFRGALTRTHSRRYQLLRWGSSPIRYRRTGRHIRADGIDSCLLVVPSRGRVALGGDRSPVVLDAGTAALVRMDQPFEVTHSRDCELVVLTMTGHEIARHTGRSADGTPPIDLSTGLGAVVRAVLQSTLAQERLPADHFDAALERLGELTGMVIAGQTGPGHGRLGEIELAVRRYVREHADDPDLNAASAAAALGWSTRQVQLALQRAGTTARELIREERLVRARALLVGPAHRTMSVTEIAHRSGFRSAGTFSTAFRDMFGVSPRSVRGGG